MTLPFALPALAAQHYSDSDGHSDSETVSTTFRGIEFSGRYGESPPWCTMIQVCFVYRRSDFLPFLVSTIVSR